MQPWQKPLFDNIERRLQPLLQRLEDPEIDGAGLIRQDGLGMDAAVDENVGFDLSNKSMEWRAGYFECLMLYAEACEHLDTWVHDTTSTWGSGAFPNTMVIGPSNPQPNPISPLGKAIGLKAPLEENCVRRAPPAESVYVKILTTTGFTTKQRLDAAIAYGDWMTCKGLHDSAEEAYRWALDIAMSAVPDPKSVINPATAVIAAKGAAVSDNILTAATSLATHLASTARPSMALPIYLSVLRARQTAEEIDAEALAPKEVVDVEFEGPAHTDIEAGVRFFKKTWRWIKSSFEEVPFPLPFLTGNEPFTRHKKGADACEDAKLMAYIGEILYATSAKEKRKADAVRWTQSAVDKTYDGLKAKGMDKKQQLDCIDCQYISIINLHQMTKRLAAAEKERNESAGSGWKGYLGFSPPPPEERWSHEFRNAKKQFDKHLKDDLRNRLLITPFGNPWPFVSWFVMF